MRHQFSDGIANIFAQGYPCVFFIPEFPSSRQFTAAAGTLQDWSLVCVASNVGVHAHNKSSSMYTLTPRSMSILISSSR